MAAGDGGFGSKGGSIGGRVSPVAVARRAAMSVNHRAPGPSEAVKAGAEAIVSARMTGTALQPRTVAARGAEPHIVEHVAIVVDAGGGLKVERSEVTALFAPTQNPVKRLMEARLVTSAGAYAAVCFAAAGERVARLAGSPCVRTMQYALPSGIGQGHLTEQEADLLASERWKKAAPPKGALSPGVFAVMDGVMRRGESAVAAAGRYWPMLRDRKRLGGMGDGALIEGCSVLAEVYGFESRADAARALAETGSGI